MSSYDDGSGRPASSLGSHIPVPRTVKRSTATLGGNGPPRKALLTGNPHSPKAVPGHRVRAASSLVAASTAGPAAGRAVGTSTSAAAGSRARLASATGLGASVGAGGARRPLGASINAGNAPAVRGVVRPNPGKGFMPSARRTVSSTSSASDAENTSPNRMTALEARVASMADLFEEEKMKNEARLMKERQDRTRGEEQVKQLQAELSEQRRIAETVVLQSRRSVEEEEFENLKDQHAREKRRLENELEQERETVSALKATLSQQSTAHLTMESTHAALRNQVATLQAEAEGHRARIAALEAEVAAARAAKTEIEAELREAESLRRKLHNEVQELRGNIRVFARVRPSNRNDAANAVAQGASGDLALASIRYPNEREANQIEILAAGESATGTATMSRHLFTFDRVFQPSASQADVFEEVAHLTQSVLDGYNTSIFAYGQTGSGKTHTLEGPADCLLSGGEVDEGAGLIPRAVQMLWRTAEQLKDKGWRYDFEGQMLEIYLDGINDLLGKESFDKVKHEVKHEKTRTIVTDTVIVPLGSPQQVFALLEKAKKRRQVAATLMNERSSRSHSVFILRVRGQNATTLESCDAVLNLVDLAGSERLSNSGSASDPQRLKEAQSINKSLSSLADVIAALGQNKQSAHIPYRNSTLTWLLKNSLGGNSKTLMLLALSPMASHQSESLCSLRFATKVNSTHIGTAKRMIKVDG